MMTFLRDRKVRDVLWQAAGALALIALVWFFVRNASENMVKAGIASGFQFLGRDSGIEVPFNLTGYKPSDTILALLWTGIVNTLLVSAVSIVVATAIGFSVGLLRLSRNWLLSTLAGFYIEFVRNIPLLFFVLFWYFGVLAALPTPRDSVNFLDVAFLNRRGLSIPTPVDSTGFRWSLFAIAILIAVQWAIARWARARQARTGRDFPTWMVGFALCGALPVLALVVNHLAHFSGQEDFSATAVRRLARRLEPATIEELATVMRADADGRPPLAATDVHGRIDALVAKAHALELERLAPRPILLGRHLIKLGLKPGDTILGMDLAHGGHLTHGMKINVSGKLYNIAAYEVDPDTYRIDMDKVREQALQASDVLRLVRLDDLEYDSLVRDAGRIDEPDRLLEAGRRILDCARRDVDEQVLADPVEHHPVHRRLPRGDQFWG